MSEQVFDYDPENKINANYGRCVVLSTIFGFILVNVAVSKIGKPGRVNSETWRWNNLLISWIHGLISGVWDLLCFYYYPEVLDDPIYHMNYFTYFMTAFSTGYFLYDFLDLIYQRQLLANWEVVMHHIAVCLTFYINIHFKMCIGYNIIALLAEVNSFFLHSRKLLQMMNVDYNSMFYRTVCYINLVTFFFCRGYGLFKICFGMMTEGHRVPLAYFYSLTFAMFIMNVINPVLFWRLLKNDVLRNFKTSSKKSTEETIHLNGNNNQPKHIKSI